LCVIHHYQPIAIINWDIWIFWYILWICVCHVIWWLYFNFQNIFKHVILVGYGHDLYRDNAVMKNCIILRVWSTFSNIPTMAALYWNPNQLLGYFPKKKRGGKKEWNEKNKNGKNNRKHVNKKLLLYLVWVELLSSIVFLGWFVFLKSSLVWFFSWSKKGEQPWHIKI
jgi:hypothetical protein